MPAGQTFATLAGCLSILSVLCAAAPPPAAPAGIAVDVRPSIRVAGICVGSAEMCLRQALADGELSDEEIALPYEVFITFDYNSAVLSDVARTDLTNLAVVLNEPLLAGRSFLIEGHTDARGADDYNQRLSEQRAAAVAGFLSEAGVDAARLNSVGLGETRPRVADPEAPANRRVELKIMP